MAARDIQTIKDIIIEEKNARLELSELESDSKVSIYNGWAYICAVAIHSSEVLMDIFKSDINDILDTRMNGTPQFYVNEAYKYQDGDNIQISDDGTSIVYPIEDESKRIITRASYEEVAVSGENLDKLLLIKVAKGEVGSLEPLGAEELVRFTSYLNKIKFAGTNMQAVSKIGDILIPKVTVYHDGLLPDATISTRINEALREFTKDLSFDSALYITKLFDAIAAVENVTDVYADPDAMPAQGVFLRKYDDDGQMGNEIEVGRFSHLASGYMKESSKIGQELNVPNYSDSIIIKVEGS